MPDDLKEEYERLALSGAKQVGEVVKTDPDGTWTVRRLDGSEDRVEPEQVFWAEEDEGDSVPLHEEEIDAILHHGHYGREPEELNGVLAEGYKAMSKVQAGGNRGFSGGDDDSDNDDDNDNSYGNNNNNNNNYSGGFTGGK